MLQDLWCSLELVPWDAQHTGNNYLMIIENYEFRLADV
jgi:hypothetical protein